MSALSHLKLLSVPTKGFYKCDICGGKLVHQRWRASPLHVAFQCSTESSE